MVKSMCSLPNVHPADILTGQTSLLWFPTDFDSILRKNGINIGWVSMVKEPRVKRQVLSFGGLLNRTKVSARSLNKTAVYPTVCPRD